MFFKYEFFRMVWVSYRVVGWYGVNSFFFNEIRSFWRVIIDLRLGEFFK